MKTGDDLREKHCKPCHGETTPLDRRHAEEMLESVPGWTLEPDGRYLSRSWTLRDFVSGMEFFQKVAELAESEDHHPDLHLENYRNASIRLTTHAIKGLSENDFILAAKINDIPVRLKVG